MDYEKKYLPLIRGGVVQVKKCNSPVKKQGKTGKCIKLRIIFNRQKL